MEKDGGGGLSADEADVSDCDWDDVKREPIEGEF